MEDRRTYCDLAKRLAAMSYEDRELTLTLLQVAVWESSAALWITVGLGNLDETVEKIVERLAERLDEIAASTASEQTWTFPLSTNITSGRGPKCTVWTYERGLFT